MHKMRAAFDEDVRLTVGRTLDELKYHPSRAFVGMIEPTEITRKENGHLLYVYDDYWGLHGMQRELCNVFLEFDPDSMRVVRATAEGVGCYRAY